jgi:TonB family protein
MKAFIYLIALLSSAELFAQTKRVTVEDPDRGISEQYFVLKSDKQTKEGKYEAHSLFRDRLVCDGYYKNNLRDSAWKYYSYDGKIAEYGNYKNGKKVGMWYATNYAGDLQVQYDFTENKLVVFKDPGKRDTTVKQNVINGTDTTKAILDRNPIYLDGISRFGAAIITGMRYPRKAKENNTQGKVIIAITISSDGAVKNYRVKKGIGDGCDEEALKAVKRTEGDWLPGLLNGKPVTSEYDVPVSFTLQNG